ncbi:MAG: hypothetical protein O3B24_01990 [Verrucomicrobia bacterium]|nr:hypothetical protein [Verrucomicrobiota bacterium]
MVAFAEILRGSPDAADGALRGVADALQSLEQELDSDPRVQELAQLVEAGQAVRERADGGSP